MNKSKPIKDANILLVEDNETNVALMGRLLMINGFSFTVAKNGMEVFEVIKESKPDIIVMDIMMPEMDGITCLKKLKEIEEFSDIPVILLTALRDEEDIIRGFESGAVDYLLKPFKEKEFIKRLETHIELNFLKKQYGEEMRNQGANAMIVTLNHEISINSPLFFSI